MSDFPWWLAAIIFFFVGMAVERFIIDRKFIRDYALQLDELRTLMTHKDPPEDAP